ncbi:hypothetical protein [Pseudomonas leptonychotis]|uniref:hypothetical protein n=1 Tax=Pseudomonas leptonychotis TaxID=2448482 RepID=UPI00386EEC70
MNKGSFVALAALALVGCGSETSVFDVTTDDPFINSALPKIRQSCPGLDRYSGQFSNVRVEAGYRTAIVFDIPNSAKLPPLYNAGGHSCFVEIAPDGQGIFIEKDACKSICLDRSQVQEGQLALPLKGIQTNG